MDDEVPKGNMCIFKDDLERRSGMVSYLQIS